MASGDLGTDWQIAIEQSNTARIFGDFLANFEFPTFGIQVEEHLGSLVNFELPALVYSQKIFGIFFLVKLVEAKVK